MRYKFEIDDARGDPWYEEYDVPPHYKPKKFIENMLSRFNSELRPEETTRKVLSFELVGIPKDHTWEKQNVGTIMHAGAVYDRYKCTRCNITGKRHGLSGVVKIDSKFKAKVYLKCDTSLAHQKKKEERRGDKYEI